jgi:hypothetical protein
VPLFPLQSITAAVVGLGELRSEYGGGFLAGGIVIVNV